MPIRLRLACVVAAIAAAVVGVGGTASALLLNASVLRATDNGLVNQAQPIVAAVHAGTTDTTTLDQLLRLALDAFGQVIRSDGTVAAVSAGLPRQSLLTESARERLTGDKHIFFERDGPAPHEGEPVRVFAYSASGPDGRFTVIVGTSMHSLETANQQIRRLLVGGGGLAVLLCGAGAYLLAGAALRPVERLRAAVAALPDSAQPGQVVPPGTRDELAALARTLNGLLQRISHARQREQQLVADASHELRTPLSVLRLELELANRPERSRDDLAVSVAHAAAEAARIAALAEDLLLLARFDGGHELVSPSPQPLAPILSAAARAARQRATHAAVTIDTSVTPEDLQAFVDAPRLRQALDNLLDNALRVTPAGGTITMSATQDTGSVTIDVEDTGPGIPAELLPDLVFHRFRRADTARTRRAGGTGLGLSIVQAIARSHGGQAYAGNGPDGGAVIRMSLPNPDRVASRLAEAEAIDALRHAGGEQGSEVS